MNNDLLKRIDESFFFVVDADGQQRLNKLLADCRAEIERPNIDALIAEAVANEREACAQLCDNADKSTHPSDLAEAIRARGIHTCHIHVLKKKTEAQKFLDVVWHPDNTDSVRVKLEKAVRILESL